MKVYLVGGAVRDRLLSLPIHERDWVVVGATPDHLLEQGYRQVGKDFPVFIHPKTGDEYALARTERKSGKGHQGFEVHSETSVTLNEDLYRRDLTINAIAEDPEGNLIDPYHGIDDLQQKVLRHVSPAFSEDPLRILRVARFAASLWKLNFTIAPETLSLISDMSHTDELAFLSKERIWKETERALLTDHPEIYFLVLWQVGALHTLVEPIAEALNYSENLLYLSDLRNLHGLLARYMGLTIISAVNKERIDIEQIKEINSALCPPKKLQEFALLTAKYFYPCTHAMSLPEERIYETLAGLDAFRREDRAIEFLSSILDLQNVFSLGDTNSINFLIDIIPLLNSIRLDDMHMLAGNEIGEKLTRLRIEKIKELISCKN